MYENLSNFDKALAQFGDRVSIIAGLEISGKITPEDAYKEIKTYYKQLKKLKNSSPIQINKDK